MASQSFRKLVCHKLTTKFADAVRIDSVNFPASLGQTQVLVKNRFVGINASDINFTAGHYDPSAKPPFDTGFEAVGQVVDVGSNVRTVTKGSPVAYVEYGAFSEFKVVDASKLIPLPDLKAEYIPLLVSALTATLALDKVGDIKQSDSVLVTAAAGGTGQFAVQWAKSKGCKVLGTCSSDDKVEFLKKLGCDRPINYKKEDLKAVLKAECPKGVDVVYECIGGKMFETCFKSLAQHGRLIIIGMIEAYEEKGLANAYGDSVAFTSTIPLKLLRDSSSLRGFFLPHFVSHYPEYLRKLVTGYKMGKLQSIVDNGAGTSTPFKGLEDIERAVQYMYKGANVGKIVVELNAGDDSEAGRL